MPMVGRKEEEVSWLEDDVDAACVLQPREASCLPRTVAASKALASAARPRCATARDVHLRSHRAPSRAIEIKGHRRAIEGSSYDHLSRTVHWVVPRVGVEVCRLFWRIDAEALRAGNLRPRVLQGTRVAKGQSRLIR